MKVTPHTTYIIIYASYTVYNMHIVYVIKHFSRSVYIYNNIMRINTYITVGVCVCKCVIIHRDSSDDKTLEKKHTHTQRNYLLIE